MGEPLKEPMYADDQHRSSRSLVAGLLLGCGTLVCIAGILACSGIVFLGWKGYTQLDSFAREFERRGYTRAMGQVMDVTDPISKPTVYVAQVVKFKADVHGDLALMAQVVEIEATVHGDIDFLGQVLTVKEGAVVKGDIRVRGAQVINVQGVVEGKITGTYQNLRRNAS
jgi:hypothetical protein